MEGFDAGLLEQPLNAILKGHTKSPLGKQYYPVTG